MLIYMYIQCKCIGDCTLYWEVLPIPDTCAGLRAVNVLCPGQTGQVLALSELCLHYEECVPVQIAMHSSVTAIHSGFTAHS